MHFHGLAPELDLGVKDLLVHERLRLTVSGRDGRMMADLFGHVLPALVGPHELVGLAEQRVEVLGAVAVVGRRVARYDERGHVHHAVVRVGQLARRVQQIAVLDLLAQTLFKNTTSFALQVRTMHTHWKQLEIALPEECSAAR